jgi:hypothetical protein
MISRRLAALALTSLLVTSVAGCGGDDGPTTAADPAPTTSTAEPTPTAPSTSPQPGSLPDFAYLDYAYRLQVRCFCPDDLTYRITVAAGEVTEAVWETDGNGHVAGDAVADDNALLTIQDIIDRGNDPEAAQVDVVWPAGQAWPNSVYVDRDEMMADEEVTWVISEVETA